MGLLHASILSAIPGVEIAALVDKSTLMTKLLDKVFSFRSVKVMKEVENLSGLDIDAVYITTPISSHSLIAKTLYSQGITRNIFVEKTLASDYEHSRELCDFARKARGVNMVGYMKRFSVVFKKAKELLAEEVLGEPQSYRAYAYSSDFLGLSKESKSSASRGGALKDIGCHVIDLALWLLGDSKVCDFISSSETEGGNETSISFSVKNSTGLMGRFDISQSMANYRMPEFGLLVDCSKGKLEVNDDRLLLTQDNGGLTRWYRQDLDDHVAFFLGEAEYFRENQHFVNSLRNNQECEPSFETASKVDYIIDQVESRAFKK
jgi:predicted dehydrogenase